MFPSDQSDPLSVVVMLKWLEFGSALFQHLLSDHVLHPRQVFIRGGTLAHNSVHWGLTMPGLGAPGPLGLLLPFLLTSHNIVAP